MHPCSRCGAAVEDRFRFCPWCSQPQRLKLVEFFAPHPDVPADRGKALRVSRYFPTEERASHFRFSIWSRGSADAAVSLSDDESVRLAQFLAPPRRPTRNLVDQLRESLRL